jgi:MoxR-like ATPase
LEGELKMSDTARDALAELVAERIVKGDEEKIPWDEAMEHVCETCGLAEKTVGNYLRDYAEREKETWDEQYVVGMAEPHPAVEQAREEVDTGNGDVQKFSGDVTDIDMEPGEVKRVNIAARSIDDSEIHDDYNCRECGGDLHEKGRDEEFCVECGAIHWNGLTVLEDVGHPLVPDVGNDYIRREQRGNKTDVENVGWAMGDPDYAALLEGETGVGKDFLIEYICAQTNRPMIRLDFGEGVLYEDLVGGFEPNGGDDAEDTLAQAQELAESSEIEVGEAISLVGQKSNFDFKPGFLYEAVENGYVFVADEINAAGPEATMALHGVTEDRESRHLSVRQTGEVIQPHKQFRFVATMNPPHYPGTKDLNDAFKTRFWIERIDYLPKEAEKVMVLKQTGLDPDEYDQFVGRLVDVLGKLRDSYKEQDIITPIGHREAEKIGKQARRLDGKEAAKKVLMDMADPGDKNTISKTIDMHL